MIKLEIITDNEIIDITNLVEVVTWSGDYTQAARQIEFDILSSPYDKNIPKVDIPVGSMVKFYENNQELFRGYIFTREKEFNSNKIVYSAFDVAIYMLKNQGVYNFKNKTPEEIAKKVCSDFGIPIDSFVYTGVSINRKFFGNELYDIIITAYTLASSKTSLVYMLKATKGKISVEEKGRVTLGILYENKSNITESSFSESISDMVNKVVVIDDEGNSIAESKDESLIKKYGQFQKILKKEEGKDANNQSKSEIRGKSEKCSLSGIGDTSCVTGCGIRVKDSYTGLTGLFYIDSDSHTWSNGIYSVQLTLNFKNIMNESEGGESNG